MADLTVAPAGTPVTAAAPAPVDVPSHDEVNPTVAAVLPIVGTLASATAIGLSLGHQNLDLFLVGGIGSVLMPSVGRWYAHSPAASGLAIRTFGAGILFAGLLLLDVDCEAYGPCNNTGSEVALFLLGGGLYLGSAIYDIVKGSQEARAYNARLPHITVVPLIQPDRGSYGLALTGTL